MTLVNVKFGFYGLTEEEEKHFKKILKPPTQYKKMRGIYTGGGFSPDAYLPRGTLEPFSDDKLPL